MSGKALNSILMTGLAVSLPAIHVKAETQSEKLATLKTDLNVNETLRAEYQADPIKVLSRYGIAPAIQIEAMAENHGLFLAGDSCICTGCCLTNINVNT